MVCTQLCTGRQQSQCSLAEKQNKSKTWKEIHYINLLVAPQKPNISPVQGYSMGNLRIKGAISLSLINQMRNALMNRSGVINRRLHNAREHYCNLQIVLTVWVFPELSLLLRNNCKGHQKKKGFLTREAKLTCTNVVILQLQCAVSLLQAKFSTVANIRENPQNKDGNRLKWDQYQVGHPTTGAKQHLN